MVWVYFGDRMEGNCLVLVGKEHCIELPLKNVFLLKAAQFSSRIGIS